MPIPPPFERAAPEPPDWLDAEARAKWERLAPALQRLDLLKCEDRAPLVTYCELWATFVAARRDIAANGLTVTNWSSRRDGTVSEWQTKNPAVPIMLAATAQLRHYANLFGLSPASERQLGAAPVVDSDDDPFSAPPPA